MATRKLYYEDSRQKTFTAAVTGCRETEGVYEITLSATAFYPEGGGQPCDRGTIAGVTVLDVQERGEEVIHFCPQPLAVGSTVEGTIDWERRFDFMQQHSGEHIISGMINKKYGYHNVGFHLGNDVVTIDFDGPLTLEALLEIEARANRYIWENHPVRCWYPTREELPNVLYRSKKALPWPVRIVEFPGADRCACCGTPVGHTGQIGLVKILSCVKFHQGVRVEMLCGRRAMDHLRHVYEENRRVSQAFSAKIPDTGGAAERMSEALAGEKFRAVQLQKRLFAAIAKGYGDRAFALHFEQDLTPAQVRELADAIAKTAGTAAVLSGSDTDGYTLCIVSTREDVRPLGKAAAAALSGRGGGKSDAFQGKLSASREDILTFFQNA